jgi:hypothetical protein
MESNENRLVRLWQQGKRDTEIAKTLGVSRATVLRMRKKLGLPARARGRPPKPGARERQSESPGNDSQLYERPGRPVSPNATFGIRDEDMPRLCPSAYRQQLDGNYELIDPADKPAGMPRKIRKIFEVGA